MKLREYLNGLPLSEQISFAKRCGTTVGYMRKALSTSQRFGPALCVAIELNSSKAVTRAELRDDWKSCWPELAATNSVPAPSDDHSMKKAG